MSTLVEHGPWPRDRLHMHSFFQPIRQARQAAVQASERPKAQASSGHVIGSEDSNEDGSSDSGSEPRGSSPSTSETHPQVHQHEDTYIDPNLDRRKRRRITPSSDLASVGGVVSSPDGRVPELQELKTEQHGERKSDKNMANKASNAYEVNATPALRRRSDRLLSTKEPEQPPIPSTRQLTINLSPPKARESLEQPDAERRTTPKRKMLHLSSGGKLVKSPKRSPAGQHDSKPNLGSSRNLSLKQGRIVSSLKVVLSYPTDAAAGGLAIGAKIDRILSRERRLELTSDLATALQRPGGLDPKSDKVTHPFFLGKVARHQQKQTDLKFTEEMSTGQNSDAEAVIENQKPVAWSDIKFSSSKTVTPKDIAMISTPWPPLEAQFYGQQAREGLALPHLWSSSRECKKKHDIVRISGSEDVLHQFSDTLHPPTTQGERLKVPERRFMHPSDLLTAMQGESRNPPTTEGDLPASQNIRRQLTRSRSAFDRGQAAGPNDWAHKYAPKKAEVVLQPRSRDLVEWLRKMKVHQVQAKLAATNSDRPRKAARGRVRPKKQEDDMDDFIVASDDDSTVNFGPLKNAIMICGPHGCGKTASVYAAAHELDFEVFEIHPGMRRSAKDIFDKVGDMTHNHLVQQSAPLSRESSSAMDESHTSVINKEVVTGKQQTMAGFVNGSKKRKAKPHSASSSAKDDHPSLNRQSLILLEEVDILFEEDKSFWPGVQALVQQSKRPIVMTCHSLEGIPLGDLPLHATLVYERPCVDDVVEYTSLIAAAEGHLLKREALHALYTGRGEDLRATLMDLDFWCQMTVGSKVGGLDWIPPASAASSSSAEPVPRVVSCGTFHEGLNLVPERPSTPEGLLAFCHNQLAISALEWEALRDYTPMQNEVLPLLARLDDALSISDSRSCMDLIDSSIAQMVSTSVSKALPFSDVSITGEGILEMAVKSSSRTRDLTRKDIASSLSPIMEDLRTFPPPVGRTSPNIDGVSHSIATEIAPYVRSIIAFDQRLEQQRSELSGGSQSGKQRTTRAARAALEGGDKSHTRRERWFPKELDFDAVMCTGMDWPQCQNDKEDALPSGTDPCFEL